MNRPTPLALLLALAIVAPELAPAPGTATLEAEQLRSLKNGPVTKSLAPVTKSLAPVTKSLAPVTKSLSAPPVTYDRVKSIKIVPRNDGTVEEQPYVPIPILFKVNSEELIDATSVENIRRVADALANIRRADPSAVFEIEGHASAEGNAEANLALSRLRAAKIRTLLEDLSMAPAGSLNAVGFGETFARHGESAPEALLQEDRRVLVVRTN
jgi:outer membrane protein OmpA-like peptidoglycan-associated protein